MDHRFGGRFTEIERLATGGEASLFRVYDRWAGRVSALKVGAKPESDAALLREFRLLSRLRHPCLIPSLDLVRDEEGAGHVLDYVPVVAPEGVWEAGGEDAVWAVLTQALRGLRYLHRQGLVHGDVAPGNVLVWREGERWRAAVGDLGLARSLGDAKEGSVRGTLGYLAPEVARGEGCGVEADLYGLAAVAAVWVDGRASGEGVDPREVMRRTAAGADAPRPVRRIGPELHRVLAGLGRGAPEEREIPDWNSLRGMGAYWGPETSEATVVGVEDRIDGLRSWSSGLHGGRVTTLALRGRVGTGRKTLLRALARSLVAEGWTTLGDLRVEALAVEVIREGTSADPVELARHLAERFRGRDLVVPWPEDAGTVEFRLLQALIAGRAGDTDARTLVTIAEEMGETSQGLSWLEGETLVRAETGSSPDAAAMTRLLEDLFAEAESRPAVSPEGLSPLAALWLKKTIGGGMETDDLDPAGRVQSSLAREWKRLEDPARVLLALLSVSGAEWGEGDLGVVLAVPPGDMPSLLESLERLHLLRRSYRSGEALFAIADPLVRTVLRDRYVDKALLASAGKIGRILAADKLHPADLELALWLVSAGAGQDEYLLQALIAANREGRFDQVLDARSRIAAGGGSLDTRAWEEVRRAGQALGKYQEELEAVEQLLASSSAHVSPVTLWNRKAEVLAALGRWEESVQACLTLEKRADASPGDRIQAKLQRAESLWQGGKNREAEEVYEEVEGLLDLERKDEWLRFAVGRARQAGQAGDKGRQDGFLRLAEEKVGEEECRRDPNYLNSRIFHYLETGRSRAAAPLIELASGRALATRQWEALVMAQARRAYAALSIGNMYDMRRASLDGLGNALALGSERMASRMRNMAGYAEGRLGIFPSAFQRVGQVLRLADEHGDDELRLSAERLRCFLAIMGGWEEMLVDSSQKILQEGPRIGNEEAAGFAEHSMGCLYLLIGSYQEARRWFEASLERRKRMGVRDGIAQSEIYLGIVVLREHGDSGRLQAVRLEEVDSVFPLMTPILRLARIEASVESLNEVRSAINSLWSQGRTIEFLEWVPLAMKVDSVSFREEIRRNGLSAIQKAADLDDAQLRRQFLNFARIKNALLAIGS